MDEGLIQVDARLVQVDARLVKVDERSVEVDERFVQVDEKPVEVDWRLVEVDEGRRRQNPGTGFSVDIHGALFGAKEDSMDVSMTTTTFELEGYRVVRGLGVVRGDRRAGVRFKGP